MKKVLVLCLAFCLGGRLVAFSQEKVYVHFDRSVYSPGETIWFKAYLASGFEPSTVSKTLYFDWYDATGKLLKHAAAPVVEASAGGQFEVPPGYRGAFVHVRAYTRWMLNFDTAFLYDRDVAVVGGLPGGRVGSEASASRTRGVQLSRASLRFFPEGGGLVAGLPCKVAFKAGNGWGMPVAVTGVVQGSDGSFVDSLRVEQDGMGSFFIRPEPGVDYWAMWTDGSGSRFRSELPVAAAEGVALQVQPHAGESTVIVRRSAHGASLLNLLVQMNRDTVYAAQLNLASQAEVAVQVPLAGLPAGVLRYRLIDAAGKPVAERVSFVNSRMDPLPVDVRVLTRGLGRRGLNAIEIVVRDSVFTNLSVAVTDGELPEGGADVGAEAGAVAGSDVGATAGSAVGRLSDLEMLTDGWLDGAQQGGLAEMRYPPDSGYLELRGRVKEAVAGQPVMLILESKDSSKKRLLVPVGPRGDFVQPGLVFYDTVKVYYGVKGLEVGTNLIAGPAPRGFAGSGSSGGLPGFTGSAFSGGVSGFTGGLAADTAGFSRVRYFEDEAAGREKKRQAMLLAAVTVKGHVKRPVDVLDDKYATGIFKRQAGYQFDVKDDVLAVHSTDIFAYLKQVVPGLEVQYKDGYPVVKWRQSTPGFFVDEAGMRADLVGDIPIADIAYVKVFYPPFLMGGVVNPRAGAIAIYTRKGEDVKPAPTKGLKYKLVEGYAEERPFYSPDYSVEAGGQADFLPDVRPTLYWNPYVFADAATRSVRIQFYNNDVSRKLRVVVEGMNATGRLIHVEKIIE